MDADGPAAIKNDLIGCYSFDATYVYFHKVKITIRKKCHSARAFIHSLIFIFIFITFTFQLNS